MRFLTMLKAAKLRFIALHRDIWLGWEGDVEILKVFGPEKVSLQT